MAQCEGTTRSGTQCKLDARPGSSFCHLHEPEEKDMGNGGGGASAAGAESTDLTDLILTGLMAAGIFLIFRSLKWFPKF